MLEVKQIFFSKKKKVLINNLSFSLNNHDVLGILGPNGAGKSTLLKLISGELTPSSGIITFLDKPLQNYSPSLLAKRRAFLPQLTNLNFNFLAQDVIEMAGIGQRYLPKSVIDEVIQSVEIGHLVHREYLSLSGGEQQRVHFARVLAQLHNPSQPRLFLLDEPTSSLDPEHQHRLLAKVNHLCRIQGGSIVVLHDLNLAAQYCTKILLLKHGTLFKIGTPVEVLTAQNLKTLYNLDYEVILNQNKIAWIKANPVSFP